MRRSVEASSCRGPLVVTPPLLVSGPRRLVHPSLHEWRLRLFPRRTVFHRLRTAPGLGLRGSAAADPTDRRANASPVSGFAAGTTADSSDCPCRDNRAYRRNGTFVGRRTLVPGTGRHHGAGGWRLPGAGDDPHDRRTATVDMAVLQLRHHPYHPRGRRTLVARHWCRGGPRPAIQIHDRVLACGTLGWIDRDTSAPLLCSSQVLSRRRHRGVDRVAQCPLAVRA